jgi:hypothetical protein
MMHAMPIMLGVLAAMAIAYRFYSAFLAAKVAALDETRILPLYASMTVKITIQQIDGFFSAIILPPSLGPAPSSALFWPSNSATCPD